MPRIAPTTKNHPTQNVNNAKVGKFVLVQLPRSLMFKLRVLFKCCISSVKCEENQAQEKFTLLLFVSSASADSCTLNTICLVPAKADVTSASLCLKQAMTNISEGASKLPTLLCFPIPYSHKLTLLPNLFLLPRADKHVLPGRNYGFPPGFPEPKSPWRWLLGYCWAPGSLGSVHLLLDLCQYSGCGACLFLTTLKAGQIFTKFGYQHLGYSALKFMLWGRHEYLFERPYGAPQRQTSQAWNTMTDLCN